MIPSPESLTLALNNKWLRKYGASSMSGNCGKMSSILIDTLTKYGYSGYFVSGIYAGQIGNHCWIELIDGTILDPSINQYGENYPVIPVSSPNYANYVQRTKLTFPHKEED